MAYTTAQLVTLYTNANIGKAPDAATTLLLEAYASQTQTNAITDGQALDKVVDLVDGTTAVAITTYQFFSGKTPSAAGLAFLVNSTGNAADLNDPYYAKFANENRYINFAVNLGADPTSDYTKAFAASYGTLTFAQVVQVAYEKIIGTAAATAAGIDVPAAIAYLSRAENEAYLKSFIKTYAPNVDQSLGVKAAVIGTIMSAALTYDIGTFASSTEKMIQDLSDDGKAVSTDPIDLIVAYPPTIVVPPTKALTIGVDTINGTSSADFYQGVFNGANATFTDLDAIDGAGGNDTLQLVDATGKGYTDPAGAVVKNIETLNVSTATDTTISTKGVLASIGNINVTGNGDIRAQSTTTQALTMTNTSAGSYYTEAVGGASQTINAVGDVFSDLSSGAVTVINKFTGGNDVDVDQGTNVTITTTATNNGSNFISAGNGKAITGAVSITETHILEDGNAGYTDGTTYVKGGTAVSLTSVVKNASVTTKNTVQQGAFVVDGSKDTTSVAITQTASVSAVAKQDAVAAVRETAVVKFADLTAGQTIILSGLTFTAAVNLTAAEVASAFANLLAVGSTGASVNTTNGLPAAKGAFTAGTLAAFTTGPASGDTVTFTSTATSGDVGNLSLTLGGTGTVTSITNTDGVTVKTAAAGTGGVATGGVTITDAGVIGTDAGTIAAVSLTNFAGATITSNALTTLNISGVGGTATAPIGNGTVSIVSGAGSKVDVLDLTLNSTITGALTDANANYTTLKVHTAGTAATMLGINSTSLTALTIDGTRGLSLGSTNTLGTAALETITISGAAGLTNTQGFIDVTGLGSLKSIDASAASGASGFFINAAQTSYKGGSGVDTVIINTSPTKAVDGGAGTGDILILGNTAATFANPSANANITGFERLWIGTLGDGTYDATGFTNVTVGVVAAAVGFANVAAGTSLTIAAAPTKAVTYALKDATGKADALAITHGTAGTATIDATGIETISLASTSTLGGTASTLALTDLDATAITVTGNNAVTVTTGANVKLTSVDGSALTGATSKLTYATDTDNTGANVAVTVKGGAGADALTANGQGDVLIGGGGADTLTINANQVTVTGGAGADKFVIASVSTSLNQYSTITDASAGDVLIFSGITAGNEVFNATKITLQNTAGFQDFADAAVQAGGNGGANTYYGWFQFSGDTYLVQHSSGVNATFQNGLDQVVKLAGLVDLSTATFSNIGGGSGTAGQATFVLG